ncbi:hypothetical protein CIG19_19075 [Enterobacterales bacterium CwR94]|nr:hypothetical protein CIG19_19075 [Enterobacterales bacterium CwR94]
MSRDTLHQHLLALEEALRTTNNWQSMPPHPEALNSTEPFCLDTLAPTEWLQWILLPRMRALLESGAPLPQNFALTPYYEIALDAQFEGRLLILLRLTALDDYFAGRTHA